MVASVGHQCEKSMDMLSHFMNYKVFGDCPDDWSLGQKLILRGCEPLPRRILFWVISHSSRNFTAIFWSHQEHGEVLRLYTYRMHEFTTRLGNVFTIRKGTKPWVSLPKGKVIKSYCRIDV